QRQEPSGDKWHQCRVCKLDIVSAQLHTVTYIHVQYRSSASSATSNIGELHKLTHYSNGWAERHVYRNGKWGGLAIHLRLEFRRRLNGLGSLCDSYLFCGRPLPR